MNDCWECIHLEKRVGGFQYCLLNKSRRNVNANADRCSEWKLEKEQLIEGRQNVILECELK